MYNYNVSSTVLSEHLYILSSNPYNSTDILNIYKNIVKHCEFKLTWLSHLYQVSEPGFKFSRFEQSYE